MELAGGVCTVALRTPDGLFEQDFSAARGRGLLAAVDELCQQHDARGKLRRVVVGVGPGSYTGLRIAASAANMLAWAEGIPAIGLSSFAAAAEEGLQQMAKESPQKAHHQIHLLVDAFRSEWYHASYQRGKDNTLVVVNEPRIISSIAAVEAVPAESFVLGAGELAPESTCLGPFAPRAKALLQVAQAHPQWALATEPLYLRETSYRKKT